MRSAHAPLNGKVIDPEVSVEVPLKCSAVRLAGHVGEGQRKVGPLYTSKGEVSSIVKFVSAA